MRPLRALGLYVAVVFIGGALLAPWLHWLMQNIAPDSGLAKSPFHRYVNRAVLGLALLGLWPLLKSLGVTSLKGVGLTSPAGNWKKLGAGFMLGFGSLAILAALAVALGARQLNSRFDAGVFTEKLLGAALSAVVVSVLEEILFRGALFGAFRRMFHWAFALAASSMVYAIVHFMESARWDGPITWTSGLQLLPQMLRGFGDLHAVIPGFFNLTLAGIILGLAYHRTGNLYFSIGLHAGWIFWLKSYRVVTAAAPDANLWLWGAGKLMPINGWVALPILAGTLVVFSVFYHPRVPAPRDVPKDPRA